MPKLRGPHAWQQLRQLCPAMRVLFASGYATADYVQPLPEEAEVVSKPFHMDTLLARVRQALEG
jgi:DNA-binding response OmpR family regulator